MYFDYVNPGVLRLLGNGHRVLDVGCGGGALAEAARLAGNEVTGVERDAAAASRARARAVRVVVHDAADVEGLTGQLSGPFDRIVFADLLEHLPDPGPVLAAYRALLAPQGKVLVSVPNVAAWTVRLALLCGSFRYAESGIMDRTHLRWFTVATARELAEEAGYRVQRRDLTPHLTRAVWPLLKGLFRKRGAADPAAVLASPAYRFYQRWLEPVETALARLWPGLFACQLVLELVPR